MRRKVFWRCFFISIAAVVISFAVSAALISVIRRGEQERSMLRIADIFLEEYDISLDSDPLCTKLARLAGGRVTIIAPDGTVLGDSQADYRTMENHLDRPEVQQAAATGKAVRERHSVTLENGMLYAARKNNAGYVLRLAVSSSSLRDNIWNLLPAFFAGILVSLLFSQAMAKRTARVVLAPLAKAEESVKAVCSPAENMGAKKPEIVPSGYDEVDWVIRSINTLTDEIGRTIQALSYEKNKAEFILDNIGEGLILLDKDLRILHMNCTAKTFFGADDGMEGKSLCILTRDGQLLDAALEAASKQAARIFDLELQRPGYGIYEVHAAPALFGGEQENQGALLVIADVTGLRRTEQIRSEFVANASHELKTPITSIRGFAELLVSGIVTDPEQERDYLGRICRESDRMMSLTEDILMLSMLESELKPRNTEPLLLLDCTKELLHELEPQAENRGISLSAEGENAEVEMNRQDLFHILLNLIDNAMKYNRPEGSVSVKVKTVGSNVNIVVEDTGIGIPPEYQTRVFERFFRVDKGRSRKMGGTGLGLAIVKHTVALYQGQITLISREGEGTRITVTLPRKGSDSAA